MYTATLKNPSIIYQQPVLEKCLVLKLPKVKSRAMLVLFCFFMAELALVATVYVVMFMIPGATASVVDGVGTIHGYQIKLGPGTKSFMKEFENQGLVPVSIGGVSRSPLTVLGNTIIINGNNIQIFEYPNSEMAAREALLLSQKYESTAESAEWKQNMHVKVKNNLVIFYMGSDSSIVRLLEQNSGQKYLSVFTVHGVYYK